MSRKDIGSGESFIIVRVLVVVVVVVVGIALVLVPACMIIEKCHLPTRNRNRFSDTIKISYCG